MAADEKEIGQLKWIEKQQVVHDRDGYAVNKAAISDELIEQQRRCDDINKFGSDHSLHVKERHYLSSLTSTQQAFLKLQGSASGRLECLKMVSEIDNLEEPFATLANEFACTAAQLVDRHCRSEEDIQPQPSTASDQGSIQAVRSNWRWLSKLLKCVDIHLQNAADYHQFFHEVKQYEQWMANDLTKSEKLLQIKDINQNRHREIANELLLEMKTAITLFLQWSKRVDDVFEKSKRVVPVHVRTKTLDYALPAKVLCNYETKEITLADGDDLTLHDNSSTQLWQVETNRGETGNVPSTILLIPGPDPAAVQAALRLRLQFLTLWTVEVKRIGKSIVWFLLHVIRDWTPEEEKMLRNLCDADKTDLLELLAAIEKTFSLYWQHYQPYQTLHDRSSALDDLLRDKSTDNRGEPELGKMLVIQTGIVNELLARYREFWNNWEMFKVLTEVTRHPEFLLVVENWKDYKFIETPEWLKKWQEENANLNMVDGDVELTDKERLEKEKKWQQENANLDMVDGDVDLTDKERLEKEKQRLLQTANLEYVDLEEINDAMENAGPELMTVEEKIERLRHLIERARETAETSHLTTSEQEETSSYVITGVLNPRTNEQISFDDAVSLGIINQRDGTYVNTRTRESMPIQMAMNAGKIKVELTTTKKTEERRKDVALITIKTVTESRPYVIQTVIDAKSEKRLSVEEAVRTKILDQKRGVYVNSNTGEELTLADALDSGLLEVEFEKELANGNGEAEAVTKTYAVHAVVDVKNKKRLNFREAIDKNIFDPDAGSYTNTATGEKLYVGDAIRKGFIKATVIHDVNAIDNESLSDANRMTIADESMSKFHKGVTEPLKALAAFRAAGKQ